MLVMDLDDTLCEFVPNVVKRIKQMFDIEIDVNLLSSSWLTDNLTEDQYTELRAVLHTPVFYSSLRPVFSTSLGFKLNNLRSNYDLDVTYITGREHPLGEAAFTTTANWLAKHWFPSGDIKVCHHNDNKVDLLPPSTQLVIEDSVHVAQAVEGQGIPVGLIDYPWNNHYTLRHPKSIRINPRDRRATESLLKYVQRVALKTV